MYFVACFISFANFFTGSISLTVEAVAARARQTPEFLVKETSGGEIIAVTHFALVRIFGSRFLPRLIVVKRETLSTIGACRDIVRNGNR